MLLSPLTLPESTSHRCAVRAHRVSRAPIRLPAREERASATPWLIAWLVLGVCVLMFVPAARGGDLLGATLPFWLVGAPFLNLAWWKRWEWFGVLRRHKHAIWAHRNKSAAMRITPRLPAQPH